MIVIIMPNTLCTEKEYLYICAFNNNSAILTLQFWMSEKLIYVKIFMFSEGIHNWEKEHINFSFVSCKFCSWKFLELAFALMITLCICNHTLKNIYIYIDV